MRPIRDMLVLCSLVGLAAAEPATPPQIPIDRVVANLSRRLAQAPNDAQAHYNLGRAHALALVCDGKQLSGWGESPDGCEGAYGPPGRRIGKHAEHLAPALEHLEAAVRLEPTNAAYHLGLAYALEAGQAIDAKRAPLSQAIVEYRRAFDLAIDTDAKTTTRHKVLGLGALVSYEAGNAFVALAGKQGPGMRAALDEVKRKLAVLEKIPQGAITPIVFSLTKRARLTQLVDDDASVSFDLDGTGRQQRWPWLRNDTALLVWDPGHHGRIRNGWQLFGSVTFFLFWRDGYEALSVLDDDDDGQLRGPELRGLAVWQDQDGDGRSQPSEVRSVESAGIVAIAARASRTTAGVPSHARGLELDSGKKLPTYDWTPAPRRDLAGAGSRGM